MKREPGPEPGTGHPAPGTNPEPAARGQGPGKPPREFWRTLDELADDPAFRERLYNEFPTQVEAITDPVERRTFLKLMGASLGLAGVTGCTRQPAEKIVPYVRQPEEVVPGRPLQYATAMTLGGIGTGLLVESHEGRPTKIEGNPDHPGSRGATDAFAQAAILDLYDPDRSRAITNLGEIRPWADLLGIVRNAVAAQQSRQGAGIRVLTESVSSPTLASQIEELLTRFPSAKWHRWDPASPANTRAGVRLAFGEDVEAQYRFDLADVIVTLDCDFLGAGPGSLRYAREFAQRRLPAEIERMNRLYAFESMPGLTGSRADHRFAVRPSEVQPVAIAMARAVGISVPGETPGAPAHVNVAAIAKDLQARRGSSLVIAGEGQPPLVHALAHAMNATLGNVGRTVIYTDAVEVSPVDQLQSLRDLTAEMRAGQVDILLILGANPVYTAPADLRFAGAMERVPLRVQLSSHHDETSEHCHWQVPEAHFLEAWSDVRGHDGTVSIVQPLIAPLYGGRTAHEMIGALGENPEASPYDTVREHWLKRTAPGASEPTPEFEAAWRRWLHDGVMADSAFTPRAVALRNDVLSALTALSLSPAAGSGFSRIDANATGLEISFRNDPCVLDGRFANNGWLQELPKPITKLTWDNAVLVSPATAAKLQAGGFPAYQGGEHGQIVSDVIELRYKDRAISGAIFPVVGHPDDCVTLHLGYGRRRGGRVATGAGFDAYAIRTSDAMWFDSRGGSLEDRRPLLAGVHAVSPPHGRARAGAGGDA